MKFGLAVIAGVGVIFCAGLAWADDAAPAGGVVQLAAPAAATAVTPVTSAMPAAPKSPAAPAASAVAAAQRADVADLGRPWRDFLSRARPSAFGIGLVIAV